MSDTKTPESDQPDTPVEAKTKSPNKLETKKTVVKKTIKVCG